MIHVIASIETTPGKRDEFVKHFKELVPSVLAEDGCIEYGPTLDVVDSGIDRQAPVRENIVTIVEKWESIAHLKAHLVAPHMGAFREKTTGLTQGLTLHITETA